MDEPPKTDERMSDYMFADADQRLQFQHEYTIAGFKTLLLMNGGAIIALLTYAGNASDRIAAGQFKMAFAAYAIGLVLTALGYLAAYVGQSHIMQSSVYEGMRWRGLKPGGGTSELDHDRGGERAIGCGMALSVLALLGFVVGSAYAVGAITDKPPTKAAVAGPSKAPAKQ